MYLPCLGLNTRGVGTSMGNGELIGLAMVARPPTSGWEKEAILHDIPTRIYTLEDRIEGAHHGNVRRRPQQV